jgi:hypothetical protein
MADAGSASAAMAATATPVQTSAAISANSLRVRHARTLELLHTALEERDTAFSQLRSEKRSKQGIQAELTAALKQLQQVRVKSFLPSLSVPISLVVLPLASLGKRHSYTVKGSPRGTLSNE